MKKTFSFLMAFLLIFLSGCWSSHEVNTLAISVCLGIDKTENGYRVSEQIIVPKVAGAQEVSDEAPVVVYSAEGRTFEEAISRMSVRTPRTIYNAHLRMIIFSQEIAQEGIGSVLDYLFRHHEYRSDFFFAITREVSARDVLGILTPIESIPGMSMHQTLLLAERIWAPMIPVKLNDLVNAIAAEGANPVIPGIEILKGSGDNQSTRDLQKSTGLSLLSYTGLGAFQKDKLVGWLSEEESKGYHYLINRIKTTAESLSLDKGVTVALTVEKAKASVKAKLVEERPEISVQIELKSILTGLQGTYDLLKPEKIAFMEKELEHKMKRICTDAVKKAQTELKSDLFGFGEAVHRKYPGYWKTAKYTWDRDFPEVPIKIKVKARIINTGSITKSLFDKKKD